MAAWLKHCTCRSTKETLFLIDIRTPLPHLRSLTSCSLPLKLPVSRRTGQTLRSGQAAPSRTRGPPSRRLRRCTSRPTACRRSRSLRRAPLAASCSGRWHRQVHGMKCVSFGCCRLAKPPAVRHLGNFKKTCDREIIYLFLKPDGEIHGGLPRLEHPGGVGRCGVSAAVAFPRLARELFAFDLFC